MPYGCHFITVKNHHLVFTKSYCQAEKFSVYMALWYETHQRHIIAAGVLFFDNKLMTIAADKSLL
jgi:hypothetical protein